MKRQSPDNTKVNTSQIDNKSYVTIVRIKNKRQVGDLNIEKVDSRCNTKKLPNVEFVISASHNKKYIQIED